MAYVTVKKQTATELSLLREPSFLSKAVFVGFFVGIFGIFLFGSESFFFKVLIGLGAAGLSCLIVDNYEEIKDVRVEEQEGSGSGSKAYQVVLSLDTGLCLGVTEVFTTDDVSVHEKVAKQIKTFLGGLPPLKADDEADDEREEEEEEEETGEHDQMSSSCSEDDFEQISKADIVGMEEEVISASPDSGEREGAGDATAAPNMHTEDPDTAEVKATPKS
ncbi:hypothetical protein ElyMa_007038700 [Elysia marginata]|uniref:Essential for reactive oxygen species protein n=1 Tax=Elysia marginata TaxID=1093978 RepID=A0AAV4JU34_9GAST|nr:hypothetical protein ElyMa_007038700 [Elysia marginata]